MAKMQVFTLENLQQYDGLIKNYIDTADAKSLKTVAIDGNKIKFYRVEEPVGTTEPAYEIELPETDVSGLLEKLTGATEGNVIVANSDGTIKDSGIKSADLALKSEVEAVSEIANEAKEALEELNNADTGFIAQAEDYTDTKIQELTEGAIKDNADAIVAINDADTGILKTAQTYADEKVTELADGQVKTNKEAIEKLNGNAETEGSVAKAIKDASDAINAKIGDVEEGKTVVEMIEDVIANGYDDTEVRELIGDVTTLKTTEKDSVVGAINEVSDAVAAHKTAIDDTVTTLVGSDTGKSVRTIANEELVAQLIPEAAKESLDTLEEIAAWIQSHPEDASAMSKAIDDLEALVGTLPEDATATDIVAYIAEVVGAEKTRAEGIESGLEERIEAIEGLTGEGIEPIPEASITALFA